MVSCLKPLVSVGIPTYNRAQGLRQTLECFTTQTFRNLEIIVSDNASTDGETEQVAREFMALDSRIRYFRQPQNKGINFNFQFVLEQATGEYFMWAADDDWRSSDYVEKLCGQMVADDSAVMAFCNFDMQNEAGEAVAGYVDPMPALRIMAGKNRLTRQMRLFLLPEGQAIPHAMYGLIRRRILIDFSWSKFTEKFGFYGADALFIFWLMGQGHLALSDPVLFKCTVGNVKNYSFSSATSRVRLRLSLFAQQIRYIFSFPLMAQGTQKWVLFALSPWKLIEICGLLLAGGCNLLLRQRRPTEVGHS